MADESVLQMTPYLTTPAADDVLYIGDISEAVADDQNKGIEVSALFDFLSQGAWDGDIVIDTTGTLDLQAGSILLNENVNLTATSTDLNQMVGLTIGGTGAGDIVTIDDTQTLTNKTLTTPTIGDLTNMVHDHTDNANGGAFTTLSISADTDNVSILHRGRLGYNGTDTDEFAIAHYDRMSATGYAIKQTAAGATRLNSETGAYVEISQGDTLYATISASTGYQFDVLTINYRTDTDAFANMGRAWIGYNGTDTDVAGFGHYDQRAAASYAVVQSAAGATIINAATGQTLSMSVNDTVVFDVSASGLAGTSGARITQFDDDDTLTADSATRGITQAAVKGYVDGRVRTVTAQIDDPTTAVATGNDLYAFVIPADLNGLDLTGVICGVYDKGVTGTTDVMIHRRRAGANADMLSTAVTIGDEWFAADGVIDTANDDVQTGDAVVVDIDTIHSGTAPNGLFVTLEFS